MTIERKRQQIHRIRIAVIAAWLAFVVLLVLGGLFLRQPTRAASQHHKYNLSHVDDVNCAVTHSSPGTFAVFRSGSTSFSKRWPGVQTCFAQIQLNGDARER